METVWLRKRQGPLQRNSKADSTMDSDPTRAGSALAQAHGEGPQDAREGRIIDGRYRIVERLGEGGMGAVFVAEHLTLQKRVALKTIHRQFAGNDEMAARFAREAMTSAHLEHPNVVSVLDYGILPEGGAFLVMQLVTGASLRDHLTKRGTLPWSEACQLVAQIADAVAFAHAHGIVHRDLKPDNVLLVASGSELPQVKVLDFGIAHVKAQSALPSATGRALTVAGTVMGTPGYMPPEQAMGQGVDERADLYALGVMLWELLEGHCPFAGETFSEIFTKQIRDPAPELSTVRGPEALRELVRALLQRAPAQRPASAALVRETLRGLAQQGQNPAPTANPSPSALAPRSPGVHAAQTLLSSSGIADRMRALPKSRLRAAAIGACALLALLVWSLSDADEVDQQAARTAVGAERSTRKRAVDADRDEARGEAGPSSAERSSGRTREGSAKADKERPRERLKRTFDGLFK
jgi:serine/threonine protein kinase